ncbi:hypothetical protein PPYR_13231 [Photinus pyralis]|uniref:Uncharacterized protein n=1 Tax=Photinus pyralis TaxID=7054 RepID=A0A1Y1NES6_PHOPY|nr:uncharacterized protein LOC116179648 [Photinus pyralis]KAB0793611.1 hypothetical protein PPYR_13231 [Photinus pyralis]
MKYILAAIFLIGTTLAYPVGEENESKPDASIINPNSLSSAKSQESDEVPKHSHHDDESHKDVSHEHHKDIQHDSSEASEESESIEKQPPKLPEPLPEIQPEEKPSKPLEQEEPKPKEEQKLEDEKPQLEEKLIDMVEAANKPAAIAAESAGPDDQFAKRAEPAPEKQDSSPHSDSIPGAIEQEKPVADEENVPKDNELVSEGKSDILDIPQDAQKELKSPEKIAEELPKEVQQPIEGSLEKGDQAKDDSPSS